MSTRDLFMKLANLALLSALLLKLALPAEAQHPIDVQRLTAKGSHLEALKAYQKLPKRRTTTEASVSAAKSAWALGLPDMAIEEFDRALKDETLPAEQRALILLSKGIIEFQEGRFQLATVYADRASKILRDPSSLRGRVWLLWGESLFRQKQYPAAEDRYIKALSEVRAEELPSANYYLGVCRLNLGRPEDAKNNFESIPLDSEHAPSAVRFLAQISLDAGLTPRASFWLSTGREQFPESFLDSWVDYALVRIAIEDGDIKRVRTLREQAMGKYAPSDHWLNLLEAAAEAFEWEQLSGSRAQPA